MQAHILAETGVPASKLEAVSLAIETIGRRLLRFGVLDVNTTTGNLEESLPRIGSQVDSAIITSVPPWEDRSMHVMVVKSDLGASDAGLNFCYGRSAHASGNFIVSAARLNEEEIFGATVHEAGHAVGLVTREMPQYDERSSFDGHCRNDCVMQAVNTLEEMRQTTRHVLGNMAVAGFCGDCDSYLQKVHLA